MSYIRYKILAAKTAITAPVKTLKINTKTNAKTAVNIEYIITSILIAGLVSFIGDKNINEKNVIPLKSVIIFGINDLVIATYIKTQIK